MNKIYGLMMLAMTLVMSATSYAASYVEAKIGNIYYFLNSENKNASVASEYDFAKNSKILYSGDVVIPETVTYDGATYKVTGIKSSAFNACEGLTSVTIPNTVTEIADNAFSYCTNLKSLHIPASVAKIGDRAFAYTGLNSVTVDKDNKFYDSRNDCNAVIETATNTLVIGSDKTVIPDGVTKIATAAFSSCQELQTVVIPNSVKRIGKKAFSGCVSLASVTLPEGLDEIEAYTFANCGALTSIVLPSSLTSIGEFAFSYSGLKSIIIPASVWNIEVRAFDGCRNLTTVENKTVVPQTIYDGTFSAFKKLIVPEESADAYRKSPIWSNFAYINGVATGIDDLLSPNTYHPSPIYNLSGKRLYKTFKGVNIINGKKYISK